MIDDRPDLNRGILVFSIWGSLGVLGLCLFLEGMARDSWPVAAGGVAVIVLAFVAHIVVNALFGSGFTAGETVLGIAAYGLLGLVFVAGALTSGMTATGYYSGLTLFGALAAGFIGYLVTRHGLRGAFSQFHIGAPGARKDA